MTVIIEKHNLAEVDLIKKCLENDMKAQEQLYNKYAPRMLSVCYRYACNLMEAEDILQEAFIRMFDKLHLYSFNGSFEGWFRKLVVNSALNHIEANKKFINNKSIDEANGEMIFEDVNQTLYADDLMRLISALPEGYRTVFNLYVIDGYKHEEIAKMLNISENTSKSQLSRARSFLKKRLEVKDIIHEKIY